jgi:hypothetical protein
MMSQLLAILNFENLCLTSTSQSTRDMLLKMEEREEDTYFTSTVCELFYQGDQHLQL